MTTGTRVFIAVLTAVILACCASAFALEWSGRTGAAAFLALATTALGILCPSPFRHESGAGVASRVGGVADGGD